ncbi:MAG: hypothetical protein P0Y52_00840 [Candidatus Brevundimonas phytovorans]|nr:hypothetical protein [Brevundimonas sp.]WEK58116.1 MAG: hypothetical protein P0Y52_00840 [Brevundimonas sp.]
MNSKLMTSAFALTAVLAFSALPAASALANPWSGGPDINDSFNDNSRHDTDLDVDITDSMNDNSTNDNSKAMSFDSHDDNSKVEDSNNDNSKVEDSNNDNSKTEDSYNDNSKIEDSYNSDSSTNDSNNDNSDNSTTNMRISMSIQELSANVSGFEFDVGGGHHDGELRTGDISNSGGAFAGFAGIQTANYNTGFAANNQAATAISANANVTFGNGGGGE